MPGRLGGNIIKSCGEQARGYEKEIAFPWDVEYQQKILFWILLFG